MRRKYFSALASLLLTAASMGEPAFSQESAKGALDLTEFNRVWFKYTNRSENIKPVLMDLQKIVPNEKMLHQNAHVMHHVLDLDFDGTGEVIFYLGGSRSCQVNACPIFIMKYQETEWKPILNAKAAEIFTKQPTLEEPFKVATRIGSEAPVGYTYIDGSFVPDNGGKIEEHEFKDIQSADLTQEEVNKIIAALSRDIQKEVMILSSQKKLGEAIKVSKIDLNKDGTDEYFVTLDNIETCDSDGLCAVFVYSDFEKFPLVAARAPVDNILIERVEGKLPNITMSSEGKLINLQFSSQNKKYEVK